MSIDTPDLEPPKRDITRLYREGGGPIIILVEPQLAENIGTVARAMANFGLGELRLVAPRDGWPNAKAYPAASGANRILDEAKLFPTFEAAIADLTFAYATTARMHDQIKPVVGPSEAVSAMGPRVARGEKVGVVFGRERNGLINEEVALCDAILTYPVNPDFSSLNLAQAVLILGYQWFTTLRGEVLPLEEHRPAQAADKAQIVAFNNLLERALDKSEFFRPPEKRAIMVVQLRNIVNRIAVSRTELATLHGAIHALITGGKGPATGGILSPEAAGALRAMIAEVGEGGTAFGTAPLRGIARLLRRNPTQAEKMLWAAILSDSRFAGRGFKRAVPVGPHVADIVSFDLRVVIDIASAQESEEAAAARRETRRWLGERGYRVVCFDAEAITSDLATALEHLQEAMSAPRQD
ncbi:MAG: TrmJ/YjtD family RNA methyltransferase [Alphaproteobacteria bacterium]